MLMIYKSLIFHSRWDIDLIDNLSKALYMYFLNIIITNHMHKIQAQNKMHNLHIELVEN